MTITLITGCSSGIGLAAAVEFARQGHAVVATMRDPVRAGALRAAAESFGVELDLRTLDVADDESVTRCVAGVLEDYGAVDVVISNAGLGVAGSIEEISIDDFRLSFETNVLGSVRLLHAVLPEWRVRRKGRFLAVSSIAGVLGQPFNDAYCMSKFALEGMLESLAPVATSFGIHVSLIEPGPVAGAFVDNSRGASAFLAGSVADDPYSALRQRFQVVQRAGYAQAQTNEEIAAALWEVASAQQPALRYQTSEMVAKMVARKLNDVDGQRVLSMTRRWLAPSD